MKTFLELNEVKLCETYNDLAALPQLCAYITDGVPTAIAAYLQSKMAETGEEEVKLSIPGLNGTLITFTLTASKKGDSVAFVPGMELGDVGYEVVNADKASFDLDDIETVGFEITKSDELFIDCLKNAFANRVYKDGKWIKNDDKLASSKGLVFDDVTDIGVATATVITTLLEVLTKYKDAASDVEYEVPCLGVFKISPSKAGYTVSCTFDKGFKNLVKNDALAESMYSKLD